MSWESMLRATWWNADGARGGSAALMALSLRQSGERRTLWLFDTFEGLPAPTADDPDYEIAELFTGSCLGRLEEVRELFREQGVAQGVRSLKVCFQDTIRKAQSSALPCCTLTGTGMKA